jgi:hypothetical protein
VTVQIGAYDPAGNTCLGRAGNSAKAAMAYEISTGQGMRNLGIYNCAYIPGTDQLSVHAVGRALDVGTPKGVVTPWSLLHVEQLRLFSHEAGIQGLIHNRRAWWSNYGARWLNYDGSNPHINHIHIEIQLKFLDTGITTDWWHRIFYGPAVHPYPNGETAKRGGYGKYVQYIQGRLRAHGFTLAVDESFGPITEACVRSFQSATGLAVDGIVGPQTYGRLG